MTEAREKKVDGPVNDIFWWIDVSPSASIETLFAKINS
jgi:hypothetical protein